MPVLVFLGSRDRANFVSDIIDCRESGPAENQ
jgi:hypothetical protein